MHSYGQGASPETIRERHQSKGPIPLVKKTQSRTLHLHELTCVLAYKSRRDGATFLSHRTSLLFHTRIDPRYACRWRILIPRSKQAREIRSLQKTSRFVKQQGTCWSETLYRISLDLFGVVLSIFDIFTLNAFILSANGGYTILYAMTLVTLFVALLFSLVLWRYDDP